EDVEPPPVGSPLEVPVAGLEDARQDVRVDLGQGVRPDREQRLEPLVVLPVERALRVQELQPVGVEPDRGDLRVSGIAEADNGRRPGNDVASLGRRPAQPPLDVLRDRPAHRPTAAPASDASVSSSRRFHLVISSPGRPAAGSSGSIGRGRFETPIAAMRTSSPNRAAATPTSAKLHAARSPAITYALASGARGTSTAVRNSPGSSVSVERSSAV